MAVEHLAAENAARPVARVMSTSELFAAVMHRALDVYPPYMSSHIRYVPNQPVGVQVLGAAVIASHVCSAWRTLCIHTPTLWARQIGLLPRAIVEFLVRSRDALIDVVWNSRLHDAYWPASASVQSTRLASLSWTNRRSHISDDEIDFLCKVLSGSLTNLTTLSLWEFQWKDIGLVYTLYFPRLVHLNLRYVCFASYFEFNMPLLEKLELFHCDLSCSSILGTLRHTPALEVLSIQRWRVAAILEGPGITSTYGKEGIDLPCLRVVDVSLIHSGVAVTDAVNQLISSLHMRPQTFSVSLEADWTQSLLLLCLDYASQNAPSWLQIENDLRFYPYVNTPPAPLPPLTGEYETCAIISDPHLPWLADAVSRRHGELSNLTNLVMITRSAECLRQDPVLVRSLMIALPRIESYWVLNSTYGYNGYDEYDVHAVYECLIRGLAPGPTENDQAQKIPFHQLRTFGLCVSSDDEVQLFSAITEVFTSRLVAGVNPLKSLSLSWVAQPSGDNVAVTELLSVIPKVHWGAPPSHWAD